MTTVNITFTTSIDGVANWNEVTGQGTTGQKIADLLDDSGASTGLSLWVTTAFTNSFFSSSIATAAAHGIPEIVWDQVWYSDGSAAFEIRGFSAGQTGTIDLAGAGGNATRDTNFIVNGGSPVLYDAAGTGTPTAPVSIPFTADGSGVVNVTGAFVSSLWYLNFAVVSYTVETGPTITAADDITAEGQPATFTLSGNENAPTGITINGEAGSNITFVSENTGAGTETYSYEPPLIADDDTADLVVSVDGTTAGATIAYANSFDRDQLTHPATEAEYSENSLSYPNAYATTQPYEWKVIADANASVVTIDWNALEADDGFHKNVSSYATPVANGSTTVTLGVFVPETGQAYQFDRTITVSDGSVVVEGEGLFRSLFSALEKPLFKPLFR
jgi:hypothetical protein